MLFYQFFTIAIIIFLIGTLYRIYSWLTLDIGPQAPRIEVRARIRAVVLGVLRTLVSFKVIIALKILVLDAILQVKVARDDFLRWLMHTLIIFGFLGLLLMHALAGPVTQSFFPDYQSTRNPFLFLRNFMGMMVLVGVAMALIRRLMIPRLRITSNSKDRLAIAILFTIIVSGFFLESLQIISEPMFDEMVLDYMGTDDPEEVLPLKAYWARNYGVVFDEPPAQNDEELLQEGAELHEMSCMECHQRPSAAFTSYPLAKLLTPVASFANHLRMDYVLWYIHFMACFLGLAYLPFSRFFHIIASPFSLITAGVAKKEEADTPAKAVRRAMALDACTHCGACSAHCSVGPVFQRMGNPAILPSEKLLLTHRWAQRHRWSQGSWWSRKNALPPAALTALGEGSFICTDCYRCTTVCPAGLDLQDLWFAGRRELAENGYPSTFGRMRGLTTSKAQPAIDAPQTHIPGISAPYTEKIPWLANTSFAACFECQTCTNACPVVAAYAQPGETLGLLPHQIVHAVGLGLTELALSAAMVWDCVTCYKCQEYCPQGVQIAEVLYALKNLAWEQRGMGSVQTNELHGEQKRIQKRRAQ